MGGAAAKPMAELAKCVGLARENVAAADPWEPIVGMIDPPYKVLGLVVDAVDAVLV